MTVSDQIIESERVINLRSHKRKLITNAASDHFGVDDESRSNVIWEELA